MAYHIANFRNDSDNSVLTANPHAQRDTYFISPEISHKPEHNPRINDGQWQTFDEAFTAANFIYTGTHAYCFWDSGDDAIVTIREQDNKKDVIYNGKAGDLTLTVNADGTIQFEPAG